MRCGEHNEHTTRPHFLQWCFLYRNVNCLPHTGHCETSESGCQRGNTMSLCLLTGPAFACGEGDGGGGSGRWGAGDESSTIGSELLFPAPFECILILDGRLMGESLVVRRLLRSELRDDEESVRGRGRLGSVWREEEGWRRFSETVAGSLGGWRLTAWSVPDSRRKSIHVSPPYAWKCDATAPCEEYLGGNRSEIASLPPSVLLHAPSSCVSKSGAPCVYGLLCRGSKLVFGGI